MAQNILSDEFAREAALAGRSARRSALDAGLAVPSFDEATGKFYIERNGRRFGAEFVNGHLEPLSETKNVDAA